MNKDKVIELLESANSVAIYAHINTDCDAVGSSLALREVLLQLGKKADVFVHSNFPSNFDFYGNLDFYNKKLLNLILAITILPNMIFFVKIFTCSVP